MKQTFGFAFKEHQEISYKEFTAKGQVNIGCCYSTE